MNWIVTSFLMFVSSIIYYLIIKKAQLNKIENKLYMVFNFAVPTLLFLFINISKHINIFIDLKLIGIILLISFFLNYIGSSVSYLAISKAPNAGYSVIIQKSYAVYTSIAAIYLFHSFLSLRKFFAILFIIFSTAIVSITRGKKLNFKNYQWVVLSFVSFFCFGTLRLANKLIISAGVPVITLLFWAAFFTTIISLIDLILNKKQVKTKITINNFLFLLGIGVSVTFFYYFLQTAEVIAPNIGYVGAINTASNAFYTILVALIFKDHLSVKKFLAVLGVTAGLILLVI